MPKEMILRSMTKCPIVAWQMLQALVPTCSDMPLELGSGSTCEENVSSSKCFYSFCQSCRNSMVCLQMNVEASGLVMFLSDSWVQACQEMSQLFMGLCSSRSPSARADLLATTWHAWDANSNGLILNGIQCIRCRDEDPKRVYYLSMEFLMGRSLTNALCNLGMNDSYTTALREMGYDLETLVEQVCNLLGAHSSHWCC